MTDDERSVLIDERDQLLRSLTDLDREHDAGDIDEADFGALRDSYTARAAAVLRQLSDEPLTAVSGPPALESTPRKVPLRGLALSAVVGIIAIGTGIFVARSAGERIGGAGLTGSVRSASSAQNEQITTLLETARNNLANDPFTALKAYDSVTKLDSENVEAIAYSGWLVRNVGRSATDEAQQKELLTSAIRRLDDAIRIDPTFPDALAFRAIVYLRDQNDPTSAAKLFDALDLLNPPDAIKQLVGSAEQEARDAAKTTATTTTVPAASPSSSTTASSSTTP